RPAIAASATQTPAGVSLPPSPESPGNRPKHCSSIEASPLLRVSRPAGGEETRIRVRPASGARRGAYRPGAPACPLPAGGVRRTENRLAPPSPHVLSPGHPPDRYLQAGAAVDPYKHSELL